MEKYGLSDHLNPLLIELYWPVERKHTGVSAEAELESLWILPEETGGEQGVFIASGSSDHLHY